MIITRYVAILNVSDLKWNQTKMNKEKEEEEEESSD